LIKAGFLRKIIAYITIIGVLIILHLQVLTAQNTKGAETDVESTTITGKTRALVIGISKYESIRPLNYADKDAMVFAGYLKYHPKWALPDDQIKVLLNQNAKNGDILEGLMWLKEESKENDKIIIFFSGHGDVETLTDANEGYLLAHNTPKSNYIFGGVSVSLIKNFITTYTNNKVKVMLITDACRSGELAGGIKGTELTNAALKQKWSNEIKILSAQPTQSSYEDTKWGGGRGVFSYYLIKGMSGEADMNKNDTVTLSELEYYVGTKVFEATGEKQQPSFEGGAKFSTVLSVVDKTEVEKWGKDEVPVYGKSSHIEMEFIYTEILKGYEGVDWLKFETDSLIIKFNEALNNHLLLNNDRSASYYYQSYVNKYGESSTSREMKRKLKGALINGTQDIINKHLAGHHFLKSDDFKTGIDYSNAIIEMITNDDPLYDYYENKLNFFKAGYKYGFYNTSTKSESDFLQITTQLKDAISKEPHAAYLYEMLGVAYMQNEDHKNAEKYLLKAIEISPTWLLPKYDLGINYYQMGNKIKAINYLEESLKNDTTANFAECRICLKRMMVNIYTELKRYNDAEKILRDQLRMDPTADSYYFWGLMFDILSEQKKYDEIRIVLNDFGKIDTTHYSELLYSWLDYYEKVIPFDEQINKLNTLENHFLKNTSTDSINRSQIYTIKYWAFKESGDYNDEEGMDYLQKSHLYDPTDRSVIVEILSIYSNQSNVQELLQFIDNAKKVKLSSETTLVLDFYLVFAYAYEGEDDDKVYAAMDELLKNKYMTCEYWKESNIIKLAKNYKKIKDYQKKVCGN